jgi:two-component system response regulator AlgR
MKIIIADDEKPARDRLKRMLANLEDYDLVAEASNGSEVLTLTQKLEPDIILLDIRMPLMDGLQAAHHLLSQQNPPAIIFTTAFTDHALEAFETHAIDYLLKPVKLDRLRDALASCARLNRAQTRERLVEVEQQEVRKHICARVRGNLVLIPLEDIFYFQAGQKYVTVRHTGGEVLIEEPLKLLEQEFSDHFLRIHRNALVRLDKVAGMKNHADGHQLIFDAIEDRLEVSRRHLSRVRKTLKTL